MLNLSVIAKESYQQKMWKNGKGITFEIAQKNLADSHDFMWRLSMAELKRGPSDFSCFPNTQRILILIEGKPIDLTHPQIKKSFRLPLWIPYEFDGELKTSAHIFETGLDFNIMFKKNITAKVDIVTLLPCDPLWVQFDGSENFVFCSEGEITLETQVRNTIRKYDTLKISHSDIRVNTESFILKSEIKSTCFIIKFK